MKLFYMDASFAVGGIDAAIKRYLEQNTFQPLFVGSISNFKELFEEVSGEECHSYLSIEYGWLEIVSYKVEYLAANFRSKEHLYCVLRYIFEENCENVVFLVERGSKQLLCSFFEPLTVSEQRERLPPTPNFNKALLTASLDKLKEGCYPGKEIPVFVSVYKVFHNAYHTALDFGRFEVAYGKSEDEFPGIYVSKSCCNMEFQYLYSFYAGECFGGINVVVDFLLNVAGLWKGSEYNIIKKNCNDFTAAVLRRLGIPFNLARFNGLAVKLRRNISLPTSCKVLLLPSDSLVE